ncbi:hypothetical protein C8J57DRAFT_1707307 [Mycena rebaudengoi]|nr:hypothetical protein C8J57DRAFT_1707307 [Mycena rebaudengoi]
MKASTTLSPTVLIAVGHVSAARVPASKSVAQVSASKSTHPASSVAQVAASKPTTNSHFVCAQENDAFLFFRLHNRNTGDRLYTTNGTEENDSIANNDYVSEGIAAQVFIKQVGSTEERNSLLREYRQEGIAAYIYPKQICGSVPFYRATNNESHLYTTDEDEIKRFFFDGYKSEGITGAASKSTSKSHFACAQDNEAFLFFRLYNRNTGDRLYTTNGTEENDSIANNDYVSEGIAAQVFTKHIGSTVPLYRLYKRVTGDHIYTTSKEERDSLLHAYRQEGIAAYIYPTDICGSVPFYRATNGESHVYTTDEDEIDRIYFDGFRSEGIAGYVLPAQ